MSTHAYIAVIQPGGTILEIFVSHDGYLDHTGRVLLERFRTRKRAMEIIKLGGLSILYPRLHPGRKTHSFYDPEQNTTIAYHRDRGDKLIISEYFDYDIWESIAKTRYNYIWIHGKWHVYEWGSLNELTEEYLKNNSLYA